MLYENELCSGCGKVMAEGNDDIVVCPVCATPQHRACWQKENHCVNEALHAQGFVWSAQASASENEPEQSAEEQVCPFCSSHNNPNALHCESCGAPLGEQEQAPPIFQPPYVSATDEVIGGENAADVAVYVRTSVERYMQRFRRFSQGSGGITWNWAAFFFSPFWFFYRRMYKLGVFFVVVLATLTLVTAIPLGDFQEVYTEYYDEMMSEETTDERLIEIEKDILSKSTPIYYLFAVNLLLRILCALIANKAYYKKMLADFKLLHETSTDDEMFRYLLLQHGGAAPMSFVLGVFGYQLLYRALLYISNLLIQS